ncbi:MAG: MATE family efflux transporter, partial [Aristaeellaceae bacterium]
FSMGVFFGVSDGLQPLCGQSYSAKDEKALGFCFRAGSIINLVDSLIINGELLVIGGAICALFGADQATLDYSVRVMPLYSWGFVVVGLTTNISSYLYSTKRSHEADVISILRSFVINTIIILLLPRIFGGDIIWHTFGIAEAIVLLISVVLLKRSERSGIDFR